MGALNENVQVIDRSAITFNSALDISKLVGSVMFSAGGIIISVSMLMPSCVKYDETREVERGGSYTSGVRRPHLSNASSSSGVIRSISGEKNSQVPCLVVESSVQPPCNDSKNLP